MGVKWNYKFLRLYKNSRIISLIKAIGSSWFGMGFYIEPPGIAPGIFPKKTKQV